MKILQHHDNLKLLYAEIVKGRSYDKNTKCYIKHLNDLDLANLIDDRNQYIDGVDLPTQSERLALLKELGLWSDEDEDNLASLLLTISDNKKNLEKLIPSQRGYIEKMVKQKEEEYRTLLADKEDKIGMTIEDAGSRYMSEAIIKHSFYKDKDCISPLFTSEISDAELSEYSTIYDEFLARSGDRNVRILACMPFVLNLMSYCKKNICDFLGKPLVYMTHLQSDLISKTSRNLNVIENTTGDPPDITEFTEEQELLDWYDSNYSVWVGKLKSNDQTSGVTTSKKYVHGSK